MPVSLLSLIGMGAQNQQQKVGGLQDLGNQWLDREAQKANIERQNYHNMEIAKYNASQNLELWNRQNQYNTPALQMQRFRDAGLNPNLIYGQSNTANAIIPAPRQTNDQSISPMHFGVPNTMDALAQYQNYALRESQIRNTDSVTSLNEQKIAHDMIRQSGTLTANQKKQLEKEMYEKLMPTTMAQAHQRLALTQAQTDLVVKSYHKKHHEIKNLDLKNQMQEVVNEMERYRRTKLNSTGLEKNDPYYVKLSYELMRMMKEAGIWELGDAMQPQK